MVNETKDIPPSGISPQHYQEIPFPIEETVVHEEPARTSPPTPPEPEPAPETIPEVVTGETFKKGPPSPPPLTPHGNDGKGKFFIIGLGVFIFLIIFGLLLRFIFFRGTGSNNKKVGAPITLKYWGLWEDESIMQPLIADYTRANPKVTISYTKMSPKDYRQKLISRDASVADRPDIFRFHNTWLTTLNGVASPIPKKVMSDDEYKKLFYSVTQKDLKIGDDFYGIPLEIDGLVLLYNNKLFKAAGIETKPTTWEDVIDIAAKLTVKNGTQIVTSGIALGTASNIEHFSDILGWMILQNGGDLKKLSAPESYGALQQYRSFAEPPFNLWDETMPNSISAFAQERVAMIFAPSWQILTIKQANPDLDLRVAPLPIVPGGNPVSLASYWVEGVSRYSENQEEAWKFLRFLVEKEQLTKLYELTSKTRPFGEPYSRVDLASTLVQNEYIGPVISQASSGMKSLPVISRTYDQGINDEIIKYLEDAVTTSATGVSYQSAFTTAASGVTQIFQKYKIE